MGSTPPHPILPRKRLREKCRWVERFAKPIDPRPVLNANWYEFYLLLDSVSFIWKNTRGTSRIRNCLVGNKHFIYPGCLCSRLSNGMDYVRK